MVLAPAPLERRSDGEAEGEVALTDVDLAVVVGEDEPERNSQSGDEDAGLEARRRVQVVAPEWLAGGQGVAQVIKENAVQGPADGDDVFGVDIEGLLAAQVDPLLVPRPDRVDVVARIDCSPRGKIFPNRVSANSGTRG